MVAEPETVVVRLLTGLTIVIGSPGRLSAQAKGYRGPPDWIEAARRMVGAGSTIIDAAGELAVPPSVMYRAWERYGRAHEPSAAQAAEALTTASVSLQRASAKEPGGRP